MIMRKFNPDVFINPDKYTEKISVDKIITDMKVYRQGVERYKDMLKQRKDLGTIIVLKHPREDIFAVVDGHHRFIAQQEFGIKEVDCAVLGDFSSFIFHMTKDGWFQPSPEITQYFRVPILQFQEDLKKFLEEFIKNPEIFKKN